MESIHIKYEFVQQIHPFIEFNGEAPTTDDLFADSDHEPLERPNSQSWIVRRKRDAKILLAREFSDEEGVVSRSKEALLRLLNHPNLVCLVDIVDDHQSRGKNGYTVWEYCNKGTLNRLLTPVGGEAPIDVPESLCWHVLDGLIRALAWLHSGYKTTYPFDMTMSHDRDWQPILVQNINPTKIYFCEPEGGATYGDVKLGGLDTANINANYQSADLNIAPPFQSDYHPPEIRNKDPEKLLDALWSRGADIWSVGAVLYQMMTGSSPWPKKGDVPDWLKSDSPVPLPGHYSTYLRNIVGDMLSFKKTDRPLAGKLVPRIGGEMTRWRESLPTEEQAKVVRKGERQNVDGRLSTLASFMA